MSEHLRWSHGRLTATLIATLCLVAGAIGLPPAAAGNAGPAGRVAASDLPVVTLGPGAPIMPGSRINKFHTIRPVNRDYYMIRSYLEWFEATGGGTIVLAPGEYLIPSTLYVPSNTTIQLSAGTKLTKTNKTGTKKFKSAKSMFMLIRPSLGKRRGVVGGHGGETDINFIGAGGGASVIDLAGIRNAMGIIAGHNQRVTIRGISFHNMNNNHFVEMDACADCAILDNQFLDATPTTRRSAEAVNLDTPDALTDGFGSPWSNLDGTPNERVLIQGNLFNNLIRAIGTHNYTAGRYHADIVVRGNTLTNFINDPIRVMNWVNGVIEDNTFDGVWCPAFNNDCRAILASGAINPRFANNRISNMVRAIQFMPWQNAGKAAVYPMTSNELDAASIAALETNIAGPGLVEPFVRISTVMDFYAPVNLVYLAGHGPGY